MENKRLYWYCNNIRWLYHSLLNVMIYVFNHFFIMGGYRHSTLEDLYSTPFSGQFRRQCMHFGNSAGNFGGSAVRRPVGHDSAAAMTKLVALLPNYMQIVQNWSEKGVYRYTNVYEMCSGTCYQRGTKSGRFSRVWDWRISGLPSLSYFCLRILVRHWN